MRFVIRNFKPPNHYSRITSPQRGQSQRQCQSLGIVNAKAKVFPPSSAFRLLPTAHYPLTATAKANAKASESPTPMFFLNFNFNLNYPLLRPRIPKIRQTTATPSIPYTVIHHPGPSSNCAKSRSV